MANDDQDKDNVMFVNPTPTNAICDKSAEVCESEEIGRTLRGSFVCYVSPWCAMELRTSLCIECTNVKHKKYRDKFKICEYDSAKILIDAGKHSKDEVYIQIADRLTADKDSSVESVVSADSFCHNLCCQNYMTPDRKHKRNWPVTTSNVYTFQSNTLIQCRQKEIFALCVILYSLHWVCWKKADWLPVGSKTVIWNRWSSSIVDIG